jgi:hypothetical protein
MVIDIEKIFLIAKIKKHHTILVTEVDIINTKTKNFTIARELVIFVKIAGF